VRRWLITGAFVALLLLVSIAGLLVQDGFERFQAPGPLDADATLVVPKGAGLEAIARRLADEEIIEDAFIFTLGVRYLGAARGLKAGEYAFPAGVSMQSVVAILSSGHTVAHRLTVPEGLSSAEIVALVAGAAALSGEAGPIPAEGSLLPETYHYSRDDGRAALVARMGQAMQELLAELWPTRDPGLPLSSPGEALVLASVVEKETGVPEERPLVASVFINRLNMGMRLQSDPTVVYGLTQGQGPLGRPLTQQDLDTAHPYNTYLIDGLPPGPIANPGRAALEAVLKPAQTRYLYFVADGNGGHAFAETLDEHNRNVAKWRRLKRQQQQQQQPN
jgi:UPF0755 protein